MNIKPKFKVTIAIISILVVVTSVFLINAMTANSTEDYTDKFISAFDTSEIVQAKDIFTFDFKCAYVLNDCYISGEGLTERYDLDISINEVEAGVSENIQRIVFVDESGNYVHEFKCDKNRLTILEEGVVIYPETLIKKYSSGTDEPLTVKFQTTEHYDL